MTDKFLIKKIHRALDGKYDTLCTLIQMIPNYKYLKPTEVIGRIDAHEMSLKHKYELHNKSSGAYKASCDAPATSKDNLVSDEEISFMVRKFNKFYESRGKERSSSLRHEEKYMSSSEDSQNDFRDQSIEMDSSTNLEKCASDPSSPSSHGLPVAATMQGKKLDSDEEDSDFVSEETSAPPRKAVRKVSATRADLRAPEYARKSKAKTSDVPAKKDAVKKPRKRIVHLVGRKTSMYKDPEAPEEIPVPPKKKKLMADAMKSAPTPPAKAKKVVAPRRTTKDIPTAAKRKGTASSAMLQRRQKIRMRQFQEARTNPTYSQCCSSNRRRYEDEEDDDDEEEEESPPPTTTQFNTRPRSAILPPQETRQTSLAQSSPPSVSTPPAPRHSVEAFVDALLSTPSSAAQRDE
ncbi:hypothetical protein ZWY2020_059136 [Hordeum vulgare]|nr:hypothetical protein ZWY2020_059136 [Hordeum vulgare]